MLRALGIWLGFVLLYYAFVGKISIVESGVGAAVAACATAALLYANRAAGGFVLRVAWLGVAASIPLSVLRDCVVVFAALARALAGQGMPRSVFVPVDFDAGNDDSHSAARRALVVGGVSIAPNTIALGIDRENGVLWLHELVAAPKRGTSRWPI